jgi:hypothetical protein
MSAHTYKIKLDKALALLVEQTNAAREWKVVAENRLALLAQVDSAVHKQVEKLLQIGTIFGVDPVNPGIPEALVGKHSGNEMVSLTVEKITAVAAFTSNLTKEAVELQTTLSSTLSIALEGLAVSRPQEDLHLEEHQEAIENSTSPLQETFDQIENVPDDQSEEEDDSDHPNESDGRSALVLRPSGVEELFR